MEEECSMGFCLSDAGICPGCAEGSDPVDVGDMHYISGELLSDMAYKLYTEWEKLGIYLGVDVGTMNTIRGEKRNIAVDRPREMFSRWWQRVDVKTRWGDLYRALTEVHRQDLILYTRDFITKNQLNLDRPDEKLLQSYFLKMAEQTSRDWEDIGIYLHLPLQLLRTIKMEFTDGVQQNRSRQVLEAWCRAERHGPTPDKLIQVLREMKRNDVIMHIEETIENYKNHCRRVTRRPVQEQDQSASLQISPSQAPPPQAPPHPSPITHTQPCSDVPHPHNPPGHTLHTPNTEPELLHQPGSNISVADNSQIPPHPNPIGTLAYQGGPIHPLGSMPSVDGGSMEGIRTGVQNMHVGGVPVANTMSYDNDVETAGDLSLPSNLSSNA